MNFLEFFRLFRVDCVDLVEPIFSDLLDDALNELKYQGQNLHCQDYPDIIFSFVFHFQVLIINWRQILIGLVSVLPVVDKLVSLGGTTIVWV